LPFNDKCRSGQSEQESSPTSGQNRNSKLQSTFGSKLLPHETSPLSDGLQTVSPERTEHMKSPPPLKVIDFAYLPKPALRAMSVDERWVVRLDSEVLKHQGRHAAFAKWEEENAFLYHGRGNRADPPGKIPKKWGGLPKELDEALMKYEENRLTRWERLLEERCITPTESITSSPGSPLTQEEEDQKLEEYEQQRQYLLVNCAKPSVVHRIRENGVTYTAIEYMALWDRKFAEATAPTSAPDSLASASHSSNIPHPITLEPIVGVKRPSKAARKIPSYYRSR
jgi:hypothetical protein